MAYVGVLSEASYNLVLVESPDVAVSRPCQKQSIQRRHAVYRSFVHASQCAHRLALFLVVPQIFVLTCCDQQVILYFLETKDSLPRSSSVADLLFKTDVQYCNWHAVSQGLRF